MDLSTLMTSQSVCRRFQTTILFVLSCPTAHANSDPDQLAIHPALTSRFYALFQFDRRHRLYNWEEMKRLPDFEVDSFRTLPWAQTDSERVLYLRPEASWRHLRVTRGRHIITKLDLCKFRIMGLGVSQMQYFQVDLPSSGLTMGILYDLVLCLDATKYRRPRWWRLLPGRHLSSYDEWLLLKLKTRTPDMRRFMTIFPYDRDCPHSAVMMVQCLKHVMGPGFDDPSPRDKDTRYPETKDEIPGCFPWQGCAVPKSGLPGSQR